MHIRTIDINGTIENGMGVASKTLAHQLQLFPAGVREELRHVHHGTINLTLEAPLVIPVDSYDFDSGREPIKWSPDWVAERFFFKKCGILIRGNLYKAWIYKATSTPHNIDPYKVEVVTGFIAGRSQVTQATLRLSSVKILTAVSF